MSKNVFSTILIIIFIAIMLFTGSKIVTNQRETSDPSSSSSLGSSSVDSTTFNSKLKTKNADETLKDKLTLLKTEVKDSGTGDRIVKVGDKITVNYRGWLATNGQVFDQSFNRGDSGFSFTVGQGVIQGWSDGVQGMKQSEIRRLKIPASLGYGTQGAPPTIPGGSDLIFDVELISFNNG